MKRDLGLTDNFIEVTDTHDTITSEVVRLDEKVIQHHGEFWHEMSPTIPIAVGDIGGRDGGHFPPRAGHEPTSLDAANFSHALDDPPQPRRACPIHTRAVSSSNQPFVIGTPPRLRFPGESFFR